jgi:VWFA-related protein
MKYALAMAAALGTALASTGAANGAPRAALVNIDVAVLSAKGEPVRGLSAADFQVLSDGVPVPIATFAPGSSSLNVVLLIDVSASMRWSMRKRLLDDVDDEFLESVQETDRVRIGSFARQISMGPPFTSDHRELKRSLEAALDPHGSIDGPSPVWDALHEAIGSLASVEGRRAVLMLTDGRGTGNRHSVEEVAEYAARAGVLVNVGGEDREWFIPQSRTEAVIVRAGVASRWIANLTGGIHMQALTPDVKLGARLKQTLEEIRLMYSVGFEAPVLDGRLHQLEVRVHRADGTVRARQVYAAPGQSVS